MSHQSHLASILPQLAFPSGISLRAWTEADFPAIQRLSSLEGWPTPASRPEEALTAWRHSWPALMAVDDEAVIGFVRAITDGEITLFVAELLVDAPYRGQGIGRLLLDACHRLFPHTRIELFSTETSASFYAYHGFRPVGAGFRKSYR
jgi:GNAT superfamily N-acetyltransferase